MDPKEVLTPEDVKELAPLYDNVVHINKEHEVFIKMTFPAPNCPMADEVIAEVQRSVENTPGVTKCEIELVWEPAWDSSLLSDEARVALGWDPEL